MTASISKVHLTEHWVFVPGVVSKGGWTSLNNQQVYRKIQQPGIVRGGENHQIHKVPCRDC